jgi:hypothetical protein
MMFDGRVHAGFSFPFSLLFAVNTEDEASGYEPSNNKAHKFLLTRQTGAGVGVRVRLP